MMNRTHLQTVLDELGLTQTEAARLLSVDVRTVSRWADDPTHLPGPAQRALDAWLRLHRLGLAWRPDGLPIGEDEPQELAEQIARYREHAIGLDAVLQKVKARGGPAAPWRVDLKSRRAVLGPVRVSFYRLPNGGFSPNSYSRTDGPPDLERDLPMIEDAYACIARALADLADPAGDQP
jgi:hypothetical protein